MLDLSAWSRLRVLDLGANQLSDDDDLGALLRRAPHLDTLSLRHNQLTDPAALADALPAGLRTLHVSSNPVSPKSLGDLLASGALDDLHTLSMSNLRVDDELLAGILRRANLPRLHSLSARRCQFGPESARALADSGLLSTLRELDVAGFRQDRRAAAAIAQIPEARHLTRLVISFAGPIDLATLTDLRASQHLRPRILDAMSSAYDVDYDAISI
jgi:aminoglycoside phosphotransferase